MAQITYNIELGSKADRLGRHSVMVRLHLKGHSPSRVLTSVKLEKVEKFWNPKKEWRKWIIKHVDKDRLNSEIAGEYERIKQQVEAWQREQPDAFFTPLLLSDRFRAGTSEYYFDWIEIALKDAEEQAYTTYNAKKYAASLFKQFVGPDVLLQSVSAVMVRQFQDWLKKKPTRGTDLKRKGSSVNKVIERIDTLHQVILVKQGYSPKRAKILSPWTDVVNVDVVKPRKAKLDQETIIKVAQAANIESVHKVLTHADAFRIWQLSHYLAGARFSDVLKLRYCEFETNEAGQPTHLRYEMMKTGNLVSVPVFDQAKDLLLHWWKPNAKPTDYVLPYFKNDSAFAYILTYEQYRSATIGVKRAYFYKLTFLNTEVNSRLKDIQEVAGLKERLTCHSSRHSFANVARQIMETDNTINLYDIQKMLGHSDIRTTQVYTNSLLERDTTQSMQAIFKRQEKVISPSNEL